MTGDALTISVSSTFQHVSFRACRTKASTAEYDVSFGGKLDACSSPISMVKCRTLRGAYAG